MMISYYLSIMAMTTNNGKRGDATIKLRLQVFIEYNSINHSIGILKRKINWIPFRLCCMNDTMVGRGYND